MVTKAFGILAFLTLLVGSCVAQTTQRASDWTKIISPDEAFFVYLPNGFKTGVEGGFFATTVHQGVPAQVDSVVRLGHFVAGAAVLVEFYTGDAKKLQSFYETVFGCPRVNESEVGSFRLKFYQGERKGVRCRGVTARRKDSLYVVRAFSSDPSEILGKVVVDSVRLVEQGEIRTTSGSIDSNIVIPATIKSPSLVSDAAPVDGGEVDHPALILTSPRARIPYGFPRPKTGKEITVRARVVLGADGSVSVIDVDKGSKPLHAGVAEALSKMIFIPAIKDGKAVSVYQDIKFVFF